MTLVYRSGLLCYILVKTESKNAISPPNTNKIFVILIVFTVTVGTAGVFMTVLLLEAWCVHHLLLSGLQTVITRAAALTEDTWQQQATTDCLRRTVSKHSCSPTWPLRYRMTVSKPSCFPT